MRPAESGVKTILIAESASVWQERIRYRFEQEGFQVSVAGNLEVALGMLRRQHFDILCLDLTLGGDEQNPNGVLLLAEAVRLGVELPPVMIVSQSAHVPSIVEAWNYYPVFYHVIKNKWAEFIRRGLQEALRRVDLRENRCLRISLPHVVRKRLFVSKSFDSADEEVNAYIEGVLRSLRVSYSTAEHYEDGSIPESVKRRISENEVFMSICVRDRKDNMPQARTRTYLIGETEYAEGLGKPVILVVHPEIKEFGLFGADKRHVRFCLKPGKALMRGTRDLLDAILAHGLV